MELLRKTEYKYSIYDGMFAHMYATLTGGVFLTGFSLYLGMDEALIGILASIPFAVTVFQLPASYVIKKRGGRKALARRAATVARLIWIPILIVGLLPAGSSAVRPYVCIALIFLSHAFTAMSYVAWLSWTSNLVPEEIRGRFFGTRNMFCGAAGIVVIPVFGNLLDFFKTSSSGAAPGFVVIFVSAVIFGLVSLRFLNRIPDPDFRAKGNPEPFHRELARPIKDRNFRKFVLFTFLWSFSVYFASPFFTLYFLRDLHFSYGFVAAMGMTAAIADLMGMHLWGKISDMVKNKAVMRTTGWVIVFLPVLWSTVGSQSIFLPFFLNILGGVFWAGMNLCTNNLLLRISPQRERASFVSIYNIIGGFGAAMGPILAGVAVKRLDGWQLALFSWELVPLQVVFVASTLFRLMSLQFLRSVQEPEEVPVGQMLRILRSVRGMNIVSGFSAFLHPFIEISGGERRSRKKRIGD